MFGIGAPELIVILVIALLVFGPRKLPELGQTLGKWISMIRRAAQDFSDDFRENLEGENPNEDVSSSGEDRPKEDKGHGAG